ncbi:hypothetical protein CkaCkLH20_10105 [Colletotrichum karsti]|uniref:Pyridoxamine 5'-phosphate oxidase Alr4036 family FMN-binding domain-containing protein n=1 Tax=Colletotrichum karsti TaxID=1095194 RepID=A0A9P6LG90_9PEZI|nr:uncharacterized protein CkaCkLH20_10105 [Colletotrichum karsti]KAF9872278.1 hypothetical protein CkaCkLH20_10105 [Colletotrichum karsti]
MPPVRTHRLAQLTSHLTRTMSSSSPTAPGPAPWRAPFLKNVTEMASPEFTLATIHAGPTPTAGQQPSLSPRTRTVIFRGLWASLPVNPKNTAELNPQVYESDMLTLTTDARMAKVPDFFGSSSTTASDGTTSSGGGAPVEACFWTDAKVQWRVRGEAYVLGPDIEGSSSAALREKLLSRMRRLSESEAHKRTAEDLPSEVRGHVVAADGSGWRFDREVTAHFGNLSPGMRGTFRNPEPGAARKANPPDDTYKLGQKVEDLHDKAARANFRVVVIVPTEVDQTDLSDAEDPRRWLYRFIGAAADGEKPEGAERANGWEKIETWP